MNKQLSYEFYHQHPINKAIHFVCIPAIVLTSMNFLDEIKLFKIGDRQITTKDLAEVIYYMRYLNNSWKVFFTMVIYITLLDSLSEYWKGHDKNWFKNSRNVFIMSWLLQFLGHFIEGRRPTLVDSLGTAVFEAPMFSIRYITG